MFCRFFLAVLVSITALQAQNVAYCKNKCFWENCGDQDCFYRCVNDIPLTCSDGSKKKLLSPKTKEPQRFTISAPNGVSITVDSQRAIDVATTDDGFAIKVGNQLINVYLTPKNN